MASGGSNRSTGPYGSDGSLLTSVVDIPLGSGVEQKEHKQLFEPPLLRYATNIAVNKTGSLKKRDGMAFLGNTIPVSISDLGTIFAHPGGQLGIAGASPLDYGSLWTLRDAAILAGASTVSSNITGILPCGIEETPITRSDDAVLHTQSATHGNLILTVWCVQGGAVTEQTSQDPNAVWNNTAFYMVRERDTNTVVSKPTEIPFTNNPRYSHISIVTPFVGDPYWVVVTAPDLNPDFVTWGRLEGSSIRILGVAANPMPALAPVTISFIEQQATVNRFYAFDMHAGADSDKAYIVAAGERGSTSQGWLFNISYLMIVGATRVNMINEDDPHFCGTVKHFPGDGVFTAVSNRFGLSQPGDGQVYLNKFEEDLSAAIFLSQSLVFPPIASAGVGFVGESRACTRLTIEMDKNPYILANTQMYVYGSQFWSTNGYRRGKYGDPQNSYTVTTVPSSKFKNDTLDLQLSEQSFTKLLWRQVEGVNTNNPLLINNVQEAGGVYLTVKAFQKEGVSRPTIGVGVTNGNPTTAYSLRELTLRGKNMPGSRFGPDIWAQDQPSKHPMGLIVSPITVEDLGGSKTRDQLRASARFGMDLLVEAEDVFPYKWGKEPGYTGAPVPTNVEAGWESPGLSSVWETDVANEFLFSYKSRLRSGVRRRVGYDRPGALVFNGVAAGATAFGTFFSDPPNNAFGGEEVRLSLDDVRINTVHDSSQTYFSGGYLGFFDGVYNGESDPHTSPGRPYVKLIFLELDLGAAVAAAVYCHPEGGPGGPLGPSWLSAPGTSFSLAVDGGAASVVSFGAPENNAAAVAAKIDADTGLALATVTPSSLSPWAPGGDVVITSPTTGAASSLEFAAGGSALAPGVLNIVAGTYTGRAAIVGTRNPAFPNSALEDPNSAASADSNDSIGRFSTHYLYEFALVYAILDEDGRFHRSGPSEIQTVDISDRDEDSEDRYSRRGIAAVRYLLPPPSAFHGLGDKTLYLEVYMRVTATEHGNAEVDTNMQLVDRFIPTPVTDLHPYNYVSDTGSLTTPFADLSADGLPSSGIKFFGERIIYQPPYRLGFTPQVGPYSYQYIVDGQVMDQLLYTEGGVLPNDPPPPFSDIVVANKRMWGIPTNDLSKVWFSKILTDGKAPEWSAALTLRLPRGADSLTSVGQMDEKVVLFSRDDIFVIIGEGPNNLGRGGALSGPTRVASDVGCVNRRSVVGGPFGVMFQSAKGIYWLRRDLTVQYIGAQVEDEVLTDTVITSAVLVEDKNQVRFTLQTANNLWKVLVYDYFHTTWFIYDSVGLADSSDATLFRNRYTTLGTNLDLHVDTEGCIFDHTATPIISEFTTAWIKLAGIQGFQRVRRAFLLGEHGVGSRVELGVQYNYVEGVSTTKAWEASEFVSVTPGGLADDPMQLGIHIPRQKCESIRFSFTDDPNVPQSPPFNGNILSSITITVGAKKGLFKMREEAKK